MPRPLIGTQQMLFVFLSFSYTAVLNVLQQFNCQRLILFKILWWMHITYRMKPRLFRLIFMISHHEEGPPLQLYFHRKHTLLLWFPDHTMHYMPCAFRDVLKYTWNFVLLFLLKTYLSFKIYLTFPLLQNFP